MSTYSRPRPLADRSRHPVERAEAALIGHYPRLVRLAYLTLPPALGRHRRVLAAHATAQRSLRGVRRGRPEPALPARRGEPASDYAWVRLRVLRGALAEATGPGWWPPRLSARAALPPRLPAVLGLRLFPRAGGPGELALDQALSEVRPEVRAAFALLLLDGLPSEAVRAVLALAGGRDPGGAVRAAERLRSAHGDAEALLRSEEFDPCTVHTRPTDLIRRRRRARFAAMTGALALLTCTALVVTSGPPDHGRAPAPVAGPGSAVVDPARLVRAGRGGWADSSRVDFTVWPARGSRAGDRALLGRALGAWASPAGDVAVSAASGTTAVPPSAPARLLYAGEADGDAVVLLHDGQRLARYTEPGPDGGGRALDLARADDADVTSAAAVALTRGGGTVRYLTAPWIAAASTRDLLDPDAPARDLKVAADGVTPAVPRPMAGGGCGESWPALQLRSSRRIVERHSFLVTDLGDLSPVHLTYTPPPGRGAPARQPREATSGPALVSWARSVCLLRGMRGTGVRAVNDWAFAEQDLPEEAGLAVWTCTRVDTWRGPGGVLVRFRPPARALTAPGTVVARRADTAACGRFGQHMVAQARWRAPSGRWYVLAAGSRAVTRINTAGAVRETSAGTTLAVPAGREARVAVSGLTRDGDTLRALGTG